MKKILKIENFINESNKTQIPIEKVKKGQTISLPSVNQKGSEFKVESIETSKSNGRDYITLKGEDSGELKRLVGKPVNLFESTDFNEFDSSEESGNLFGYAQFKNSKIKKIGSFTSFTKMIDPPTPKERPVLNAGRFLETESVKGYINRVEGNKVFVEDSENPGEIVEISLKDAIKPLKEKAEKKEDK